MKFLEIKDDPFTIFINIENIESVKLGNNTGDVVIWMTNNSSHNFAGDIATRIILELKKLSVLVMNY